MHWYSHQDQWKTFFTFCSHYLSHIYCSAFFSVSLVCYVSWSAYSDKNPRLNVVGRIVSRDAVAAASQCSVVLCYVQSRSQMSAVDAALLHCVLWADASVVITLRRALQHIAWTSWGWDSVRHEDDLCPQSIASTCRSNDCFPPRRFDHDHFLCCLLLPREARAAGLALRALNVELAQVILYSIPQV